MRSVVDINPYHVDLNKMLPWMVGIAPPVKFNRKGVHTLWSDASGIKIECLKDDETNEYTSAFFVSVGSEYIHSDGTVLGWAAWYSKMAFALLAIERHYQRQYDSKVASAKAAYEAKQLAESQREHEKIVAIQVPFGGRVLHCPSDYTKSSYIIVTDTHWLCRDGTWYARAGANLRDSFRWAGSYSTHSEVVEAVSQLTPPPDFRGPFGAEFVKRGASWTWLKGGYRWMYRSYWIKDDGYAAANMKDAYKDAPQFDIPTPAPQPQTPQSVTGGVTKAQHDAWLGREPFKAVALTFSDLSIFIKNHLGSVYTADIRSVIYVGGVECTLTPTKISNLHGPNGPQVHEMTLTIRRNGKIQVRLWFEMENNRYKRITKDRRRRGYGTDLFHALDASVPTSAFERWVAEDAPDEAFDL